MEKCRNAYLFSLKGEESNHYNSNCLLWQRCWLLCTCYGEYRAARKCADLTHCGRVTQICGFNAVKLGTSASSP